MDRVSEPADRDSELADRDSEPTDRDPELADRDSEPTDRDSELADRVPELANLLSGRLLPQKSESPV